MQHDTAGDPMTGLKWTRRTTAKIAVELRSVGIEISDRTVARLLKKMQFTLRVNHKKLSGVSPDERDSQFAHIAELRESFAAEGHPVISIDTKKRELVGRFKNGGVTWDREPVQVNDHDVHSDSIGIAIPYGVYDLQANRGTVFVGTTHDTPNFAVDSVENGRAPKANDVIATRSTWRYWPTAEGVTASTVAFGSTGYKPECATATISR